MNKIKVFAFFFFLSCFVFSQNTDTTRATPPPPAQKDSVSNDNQQITQPQVPNRTEPPHQKAKKYPKGYIDYKNGKGTGGQESDFIEHLYYGCNIMLRAYRSSYGSVFYYDLSPHVGYKFNEYLSVGVQVIYNNSVISYGTQSISYNIIGPGVFGRLLLGKFFFLQAEYDYLSVPSGFLGNSGLKDRTWSDEKMVGIGYKSYLFRRSSSSEDMSSGSLSYFVNLMYDISPTLYSPYFAQPLVYRAGVVYNF